MGDFSLTKVLDPLGLFTKDKTPEIPAATAAPDSSKVEGPTEAERRAGLESAAARRLRLAQAGGSRAFRIDLSSAGSTGSGISIPGRSSGRA